MRLLLLYLAIDHYIKADSIHFKQRSERLTSFILKIPCVSVGIRLVNRGVSWNTCGIENREDQETQPEVVS